MIVRVINRIGVGLKRNVKSLVLAAALVLVATGYIGARSGLVLRAQELEGDCADVVMLPVSETSEASAHEAYACFAGSMLGMSEASFVKLVTTTAPNAPAFRIAQDGNLVFFSDHKGTGWIVHLNDQGKVVDIE